MPGPEQNAEPPVAEQPPSFGGLRLIRQLARGGFAEVWEAEQISLGRRVAVKILRPELLEQAQMVQLFEQEARVLARLNHPNVVQVIDRGASPRGPYFVMEYVDGPTLQELLSQGALDRERALTILMQAARGLAYAHRNRVVHRDVKPANILIARTGQVKIGDFGIATVRAAVDQKIAEDTGPTSKTMALGTRAFMAPEQRQAFDAVGPQADVYSLGVILHRIVTGKLPRAGGRPLEGPAIPDNLRPIVERALAQPAEARYADAGAFREALVTALEGRHIEDPVRAGANSTFVGAGRFELLDVIRQDSRRSVYLVRRGGEGGERLVVTRYLRAAAALATARELPRLEHPGIVRIHAVGERDDSFIMLMEHMPGGDLRERLVRPHRWADVARVGRAVAGALAFVHRHGIVHGNLRPSNVLFDDAGHPRVADFGLPEHYVGEPGKANWYAPPEGGRSVAADLYALGAILFEMLFAQVPPATPAEQNAMLARRHDVPPGLIEIVRHLLAPKETRYAAAERVEADLAALLAGETARAAQDAAAAPLPRPNGGPPTQTFAPAAPLVRVSYGPALLGLAGLILAWLLQMRFVQDALSDLFSR